jgi:hypothetical protein
MVDSQHNQKHKIWLDAFAIFAVQMIVTIVLASIIIFTTYALNFLANKASESISSLYWFEVLTKYMVYIINIINAICVSFMVIMNTKKLFRRISSSENENEQ